MTGDELIRRLRRLARKRGIPFRVAVERGKGSHQTIYFGSAFIVVPQPRRELKRGLFNAILKRLGVDADDLT